ncbi:MAG TPA: PIN domain-containing protein [Gemmataceae bacterium]|nr:PIN domain-containing protein [Gemmataceae bacterium]
MNAGLAVADTDVTSFLFKGDTRGAFYQNALASNNAFVSFMTLAELDYWTRAAKWGPNRIAQLDAFLGQFTVMPPDRDLCRKWAEVTLACRKAGRPIETADAWIAATALQLDAPLLTHNRSDFLAVPGFSVISSAP